MWFDSCLELSLDLRLTLPEKCYEARGTVWSSVAYDLGYPRIDKIAACWLRLATDLVVRSIGVVGLLITTSPPSSEVC